MARARARARPTRGRAHAPAAGLRCAARRARRTTPPPPPPPRPLGVRLAGPPNPPPPAAADDDRTPAGLDDDHLHAACVARRRDGSEPGKQLELAVDGHVPPARRLDPLANGVVVLAARVVELPTLDVDRPACEEVVAAAVV